LLGGRVPLGDCWAFMAVLRSLDACRTAA